MAVVKGSYDPHEITFEDEDGAQFRISNGGEEHFVLRTGYDGAFSGYVELNRDDIKALREFLGKEV